MIRKICIALVAVVIAVAVQAQTVDEILNKYFENTGGIDKWKSLQSTRISGDMQMSGFEFPGTILSKTPNLQRVDVSVQGKQIVQAYDGETAWWINPFMGGEDAQKMPTDMAEEMTKQEFESPFLNYKDKGHTVELLGKKTIEGAETYEIKLTKKNGDIEYHYFDTENFVPIMTKRPVSSGPMKGQESELYFSDYQEVDGITFPFFLESKVAGQSMQKITIKSIEVNPKVDDTVFAFPKK